MHRGPAPGIVRWAARISAILLIGLMVAIFLGERFDPLALNIREGFLFACFAALLIGLVIGWTRERLGGVLVVGAWVAFYLINLAGSGHFPSGWAFPVLLIPGVLYLVSDWLHRSIPESTPS